MVGGVDGVDGVDGGWRIGRKSYRLCSLEAGWAGVLAGGLALLRQPVQCLCYGAGRSPQGALCPVGGGTTDSGTRGGWLPLVGVDTPPLLLANKRAWQEQPSSAMQQNDKYIHVGSEACKTCKTCKANNLLKPTVHSRPHYLAVVHLHLCQKSIGTSHGTLRQACRKQHVVPLKEATLEQSSSYNLERHGADNGRGKTASRKQQR